jgi:hypothetical protein
MWFANDGRTLATVHDIEPSGHVICCWDMDAFKPLHLPVGVPAFFGSVMVTIACWRGRRRKPPVAPHASQ